MVLSVAYTFEGIEEATGEAQFLAEEVDGSLVAAVGVVEHGQAAEVAHVSACAAGIVWCGFHSVRRSNFNCQLSAVRRYPVSVSQGTISFCYIVGALVPIAAFPRRAVLCSHVFSIG